MILAKIRRFPNLIPDQQALELMLNTQYPPAIFCTDLLHNSVGLVSLLDMPSSLMLLIWGWLFRPPPQFHTRGWSWYWVEKFWVEK
jgi:hypothetical protein